MVPDDMLSTSTYAAAASGLTLDDLERERVMRELRELHELHGYASASQRERARMAQQVFADGNAVPTMRLAVVQGPQGPSTEWVTTTDTGGITEMYTTPWSNMVADSFPAVEPEPEPVVVCESFAEFLIRKHGVKK